MAIVKKTVSPRQKMINLMYVVLMALLAINVSPEVLDGFSVIQRSLTRASETASSENEELFQEFRRQLKINPSKVRVWYYKAVGIKAASDSLCNFIERTKRVLAVKADGEGADYDALENKEDLRAVEAVMFSRESQYRGELLRHGMDGFRSIALSIVDNLAQARDIESNFSTSFPVDGRYTSWEDYMFREKPVISAITILTKIQTDIRHAENDALHTLVENIDRREIRTNEMQAFIIPEAKTVIRGNTFKASIVMAAVDTTRQPQIYINTGSRIQDVRKLGSREFSQYCSKAGSYTIKGFISSVGKDGRKVISPFRQDYSVIDPTATIASELMNVLYIGYDNPVSISVPGVRQQDISAQMTGGTLRQVSAGRYVARPGGSADMTIKVYARSEGREQLMMQQTFRARRLPEPAPYIATGNTRFRGGRISRAELLRSNSVMAAVDDGILDVPFRVLAFDIVAFDNIGNAVTFSSDGASFSASQRNSLKGMSRGQRFFITHVRAVGPDNMERKLSTSMEVILR